MMIMNLLLLLFLLLLFSSLWLECFAQSPTTPYFPEVFLGKCYERNPTGVNCTFLFENFSNAAKMDNSIVRLDDYLPFFDIANFSTLPSSIMFWSGSMAFALAISSNDKRFVTVEETSTGYVLNGMSWCGVAGASPPAFEYNAPCYYPVNDTYYGMQLVWEKASAMFAQGASGEVFILLQPAYSGGQYIAYRPSSIFGRIELPSMNITIISSITILLLINSSHAPNEKCGQGSLVDLDNAVYEKFGFRSSCLDDPTKIYNLLCPSGTNSAQCLAATLVYTGEVEKKNDNHLIWAIVTTATTAIFLVLSFILAYRLVKKEG